MRLSASLMILLDALIFYIFKVFFSSLAIIIISGLYRLTIFDKETYIVVMKNVFHTNLRIKEVYDLKVRFHCLRGTQIRNVSVCGRHFGLLNENAMTKK